MTHHGRISNTYRKSSSLITTPYRFWALQCQSWPAGGSSGKPDGAPAVKQPPLPSSDCGLYLGCRRRFWALRAWVHCLCRDRKDWAGPEAVKSSHSARCCRRDNDCERQSVSPLSRKQNCAHTAVQSTSIQNDSEWREKINKEGWTQHTPLILVDFLFLYMFFTDMTSRVLYWLCSGCKMSAMILLPFMITVKFTFLTSL